MGNPLSNKGMRTAGWQPRGSKNDPPEVKSVRMNEIFDGCVDFLEWLAPLLDMSYQEIQCLAIRDFDARGHPDTGRFVPVSVAQDEAIRGGLIKARRGWE